MSVKITDLGEVVLPLIGTEQLEIAVNSLESRRVSVADLLGSAPGLDATFVTLTSNLGLPNERILTAGANIDIVDGGAGLPVTISVSSAIGDVFKVGVPVADQVGVWTGDGTIQGDAALTFDGALLRTTGNIRIENTDPPFLEYWNPGGVANARRWRWEAFGNSFRLLLLNDSDTVQTIMASFTRVATAPIAFEILGGASFAVRDVTGLASGRFSHNGVDFLEVFTSTTDVILSGYSGRLKFTAAETFAYLSEVGVTVQDEGAPLATLGSTLDFVGAGVVASGVGAVKTITIAGGGVTATPTPAINQVAIWDSVGTTIKGDTHWTYSTAGTGIWTLDVNRAFFRNQAATIIILDLNAVGNTDAGPAISIDAAVSIGGTVPLLYILETAAARDDFPTFGQFWVRNDVPNTPMFTDDAGNDFALNASGAPGGASTAIQFNNAGAFGGSPNFEWDGSVIKVEASQAALVLDETDGGGTCFIRLTSTSTGDSALVLEWSSSTGTNGAIRQASSGGILQDTWISFFKDAGVGFRFNDVQKMITLATGVLMEDSVYIIEKAAANADVAAQGQFWVRNDVPNVPMFTNDVGADFNLLAGGSQTPWLSLIDGDGFDLTDIGVLTLREQAAAEVDVATLGQIWVRTDAFSNSLMFTNDNGDDFEVATLNLGDMNTAAILVPGVAFVECLVFSPKINQNYMISAAFEVTSPAADDINIEMVIDTNAVFKGVVQYSGGGGDGQFALDSAVGEVITNIVLIPTDGTASPNGTYITITGCLRMGATTGTHSVRAAKNADTGVDGIFEATAAIQATVINPI